MRRYNRFERMMTRYKNAIYSYAYYFSGSREDAEDLTQETLFKIWRNMNTMQGLPSRTWIMTVTRNHCIDWARARKPRSSGTVSMDGANLHEQIGKSPAAMPVERRDLKRKIRTAISELPVHLRETIIMREIQGMKYREISRASGMPLNTVKARIHRGRRILREYLSAGQGKTLQRRCI